MKKIAMLFASGFEEVEALMTADLLRRAEVDVILTSINGDQRVTGAHGFELTMDRGIQDLNRSELAGVILPGGMPGTNYLAESSEVSSVLEELSAAGKILAAICAAPTVLGKYGYLKGKKATCYPGMEEGLTGAKVITDQKVVKDGNVITSRGVGTAMEFGLALVEELVSKERADLMREQIVCM